MKKLIVAAIIILALVACKKPTVGDQTYTEDSTNTNFSLVQQQIVDIMSTITNGEIKNHVVKHTDTLWDICGKEYGYSFAYPIIWSLNSNVSDPDVIVDGKIIQLPSFKKGSICDSLDCLPEKSKQKLSQLYYKLYVLYGQENKTNHAKWMLYLAEKFDHDSYESNYSMNLPKFTKDFIDRVRKREHR